MPRVAGKGAGGRSDLVLKAEELYERYLRSIRERDGRLRWYLKAAERRAIPAIAEVMRGHLDLQGAFLSLCAARLAELWPRYKAAEQRAIESMDVVRERRPTPEDRMWAALEAMGEFLPRQLPLSDADLLTLARLGAWGVFGMKRCEQRAAAVFERAARRRPLPKAVLHELRRWSQDTGWRYASDPRRQLTALLQTAEPPPEPKRAGPTRIVSSVSRAADLLRTNARHVKHALLSGRRLDLSERVPESVWDGMMPEARARLLMVVSKDLCGDAMTAVKRKVHIAKFVLPSPVFEANRACAPEFCEALAGLYRSVGRLSDEDKVAAFRRHFRPSATGLGLADWALTDVAEALDLGGYVGPEFARQCGEWIRVQNEGTDCPDWGRSFETLRAEAEGPTPTVVRPGDAWSDAAIVCLGRAPAAERAAWLGLLRHCETSGPDPGPVWTRGAAALLAPLAGSFAPAASDWFRLVGRPGSRGRSIHGWPPDRTYLLEPNNPALRGLLFCAAACPTRELAAAVGDVAVACDQRVLRLGPRCARIRNAALKALARFPSELGAPQIARCDQVLRYKSAKRIGDRVLRAAAQRAELSPEQLVERNVPHYGLTDGVVRRAAGPLSAELRVDGPRVVVSWRDSGGRVIDEPDRPHADEVKGVQTLAKEMQSMLAAHALRLERLLATGRSWAMDEWRAAYHDHALLGSVVRRLIWVFRVSGGARSVVWDGAGWVDREGRSVGRLSDDARVGTWHPSSAPVEEVLALRTLLEHRGIRQPFKQAHREVYLLTPAERRTGRSSARFASHVLRARPFAALLRQRGWEGNPAITFDDSYSHARLRMPAWGLAAEFSTEPLDDETDGAAFRHVVTGELRFSRLAPEESPSGLRRGGARGSEFARLADVPAPAFSEAMRDLDLFVSVCSVGTDPHGEARADGRVAEYWREYAFGELTPTAVTRGEAIGRLIRRVDVLRETAVVDDRFLRVRGRLGSYRIHLGSGNVMMEPGDRHLCIVPGKGRAPEGVLGHDGRSENGVFLPFEGDAMLSIILSKAMMLAEDDKITDPSITRQIAAR